MRFQVKQTGQIFARLALFKLDVHVVSSSAAWSRTFNILLLVNVAETLEITIRVSKVLKLTNTFMVVSVKQRLQSVDKW